MDELLAALIDSRPGKSPPGEEAAEDDDRSRPPPGGSAGESGREVG